MADFLFGNIWEHCVIFKLIRDQKGMNGLFEIVAQTTKTAFNGLGTALL